MFIIINISHNWNQTLIFVWLCTPTSRIPFKSTSVINHFFLTNPKSLTWFFTLAILTDYKVNAVLTYKGRFYQAGISDRSHSRQAYMMAQSISSDTMMFSVSNKTCSSIDNSWLCNNLWNISVTILSHLTTHVSWFFPRSLSQSTIYACWFGQCDRSEKFYSFELIAFFKPKVKIRMERVQLSSAKFNKRWVKVLHLVRVRDADLEWLLDTT